MNYLTVRRVRVMREASCWEAAFARKVNWQAMCLPFAEESPDRQEKYVDQFEAFMGAIVFETIVLCAVFSSARKIWRVVGDW